MVGQMDLRDLHRQQMEKLKNDLLEKDREINSLKDKHQSQVDSLNKSIHDLSDKLVKSIPSSPTPESESLAELNALNAAIAEKEHELATLKDDYEGRLSALNSIVEDLSTQLSETRSAVPSEDTQNALQDALDRLAAKESDYDNLNTKFEQETSSLYHQLRDLQEQLQTAQHKENEHAMELEALNEEKALNSSYKDRIEAIKLQLTGKEEEMSKLQVAHEEEISELRNAMETLRDQLCQMEQSSAQTATQQDSFKEMEEMVDDLSSRLQEKDQAVASLQSKISDQDNLIAELQRQVEQGQEQLGDLATRLEEKERSMESVSEQYDSEQGVLLEKIDVLTEELEQLKNAPAPDIPEPLITEEQLEDLRGELAQSKSQIEELLALVDEKTSELEALQTTFAELEGNAQQEVEEHQNEVESVKQQLNDALVQVSMLNARLEAQEETNITLKRRLSQSPVSPASISEEVDEAKEALVNQAITAAILRSQVTDQVMHVKELQERLDEVERSQSTSELSSDHATQTQDNDQESKVVEELEQRIEEQVDTIASLREELALLESQSLQEEYEEVVARLGEVQEQNEVLKEELSSLTEEHAALKLSANSEDESRLFVLESQLDEVQEKLSQSQEQCEQYEKEVDELRQAQASTLDQLHQFETQKKELEGKNTALSTTLEENDTTIRELLQELTEVKLGQLDANEGYLNNHDEVEPESEEDAKEE
jgi:chromosome segregation ATPase